MAAPEHVQFGQDLQRVAALARTFFGHREAIAHLEELAKGRGKDPAEALVMSAAWVGYGLVRIWPQGPWQPSAVSDMLRGGLEHALGSAPKFAARPPTSGPASEGHSPAKTLAEPRAEAPTGPPPGQADKPAAETPAKRRADHPPSVATPKDMPRPSADMLDGLSAEQRRFLAFVFGVIGGISSARPVEDGPLDSLVALARVLAPLVCIPPEALVDEHTVSDDYLQFLAESLDLDVDELIALGNRLGLTLT